MDIEAHNILLKQIFQLLLACSEELLMVDGDQELDEESETEKEFECEVKNEKTGKMDKVPLKDDKGEVVKDEDGKDVIKKEMRMVKKIVQATRPKHILEFDLLKEQMTENFQSKGVMVVRKDR